MIQKLFLQLPPLNFGQLSLRAKFEKNRLTINSFILGKSTSPFTVEAKGKIKFSKYSMRNGNLDILGKIKFSPSFLEEFPISGFLNGKIDADGHYSFKVKGTTTRPNAKFL